MKNLILTLFMSSLMTLPGIAADASYEDQIEGTSTFSPVWKMALELVFLKKHALNDASDINTLNDCLEPFLVGDEEMEDPTPDPWPQEDIDLVAEEGRLADHLSGFIKNTPVIDGNFDGLLQNLVDYAKKRDCSKRLLEAIVSSIAYRQLMQKDLMEQASGDYPEEELAKNFQLLNDLTLELREKYADIPEYKLLPWSELQTSEKAMK